MSVSKKKTAKGRENVYEKKVSINTDFHSAMRFLADAANKKAAARPATALVDAKK